MKRRIALIAGLILLALGLSLLAVDSSDARRLLAPSLMIGGVVLCGFSTLAAVIRKRPLAVGMVFTLIGIVAFLFAAVNMRDRLAGREVPLVWFPDEKILANEFTFFGDNKVVIRPVNPEAHHGEVEAETLRITFREQTFDIPVQDRDKKLLPALQRFEDWLLVTPMIDGVDSDLDLNEVIKNGDVSPRLIVVARFLAPDFDPETWGTVRRAEWEYWFIELLIDGPPEDAIRVTKRSYRELQGIAEQLLAQLDDVDDIRDIRQVTSFERLYNRVGDDDPTDNDAFPATPLVDMYWQYQAMLQITPPLQYPRTQVTDYAMKSMGWTWPVAGVSALLAFAGIVLIAASRVSRDA